MNGAGLLVMGNAALCERDHVHQAIDRADLIISIGHDTIEKPPFINPDFITYAKAYGIQGARVHSGDTLAPTLENAFAGGGLHLITVPIDYSENSRVLIDELRGDSFLAAPRQL